MGRNPQAVHAPQTLVIANLLRRNRRRAFVGRRAEVDFLRTVLEAPRWPFHLLSVVGPAGIGKTALLREAAYLAEDAGLPAHWVEADAVDDLPRRVRELVAVEAGAGVARQVLILDGTRSLTEDAASTWVEVLGAVPADWLILVASRDALPAAWETDPAWRGLHRSLRLSPLSQEESLTNLSQLQVPHFRQPAIAERAGGVPLVHSLAATFCTEAVTCCERECSVHELVHALAGTLADQAPTRHHRRALYAAALLSRTTEDLLAAMLEVDDPHEIHRWLAHQGFARPGRMGLRLTRPYRQALEEDLRWRNPSLHRDLVDQGLAYCLGRLRDRRSWGVGEEQLLLNALYLRRRDPLPGLGFVWDPDQDVLATPLKAGDALHLTTMVRAHEGAAAAEHIERWLAEWPQAFTVFRDVQGLPRGYLLFPEFATAEALASATWDPTIRDLLDLRPFADATGPVVVLRSWMDSDHHQRPGALQARLFVAAARRFRAMESPSGTFLAFQEPGTFAGLLRALGFEEVVPADGEGPTIFGRRGSEGILDRLLCFMEAGSDEGLEAEGPPVVDLGPEAFEQAVRRALKDYTAPDQLRHNPLLDTALIRHRAGTGATWATRVEILRHELVAAAETLAESPRRRKAYDALRATYLEPAPTQEAAAEAVGMAFSTYRRYLGRGIRWLAELLRTRAV